MNQAFSDRAPARSETAVLGETAKLALRSPVRGACRFYEQLWPRSHGQKLLDPFEHIGIDIYR